MTLKKLPTNEVTLNSQLKRGLKAVNKELAFEIQEKGKRAAELVIANKELDYQSHEKADRAAELVIANKELGFQVEEKAKRAAELVISDLHMAKLSAELNCAKNELSTLKTENNLRLEHGQTEPETYSRFILENNPAAIRITSKETGKVLFANQSFCELIDEPLELALGVDPKKFYANVDDFEYIISCLRKGKNVSNRLVKLINGKGIKWALGSYSNTEFEGIPAYVAWIYDISNLKHMEDEASRMAYYDVLTGLPNRRLLIDRLGQALAKEKRSGHYQALLFLDLDNFKSLNDIHGHAAGDVLLFEAGKRIKECVREADTVARIGGDEFVILLEQLKGDKAMSTHHACAVAEKIRHQVSNPYQITLLGAENVSSNIEHHCTASIGVVVFSGAASDPNSILSIADTAMYEAKSAGRNQVKLTSADI